MQESFGYKEPLPAAETESDIEIAPMSALDEVGGNYPAPALYERPAGEVVSAETPESLELVSTTYEEVFAAPIEAEENQLETIEEEVEQLRQASDQLEATLPETFASEENETVRALVAQLNDVDKRRISLLEQKIYVAGDVAFRKREAEAFARERNEIVARLIEALNELLQKAKKELEQLQNTSAFTRMQMEVNHVESEESHTELSAFESQIITLQDTLGNQEDYTSIFAEAQKKIEDSRRTLIEQQAYQDAEFEEIDASAALLEGRISEYQNQIEIVSRTPLLQIEDLRSEEEKTAEGEKEVSDAQGVEEDFIDAEFEPIADGQLEGSVAEASPDEFASAA